MRLYGLNAYLRVMNACSFYSDVIVREEGKSFFFFVKLYHFTNIYNDIL